MSGTLSTPAVLRAAREGDKDACARALAENEGLIWAVVRRYYGRGVEPDDLYQLACLGFVKAVQGYDPDFGTQFSTYAVPKIAGEIRRFLRDDGAVKVSRGIKERMGVIRAAEERLAAAAGRGPTLSELSAETGFAPEDIAAVQSAMEPVVSLNAPVGDGLTLESILGDGGMEDGLVERLALRRAIEQLDRQERHTLLLRYDRGLTQSAAARVLGVSQVQVSRLERRAIRRLRERLGTG